MFPQQAICNHSCTPNVTSTHVGTTVEVLLAIALQYTQPGTCNARHIRRRGARTILRPTLWRVDDRATTGDSPTAVLVRLRLSCVQRQGDDRFDYCNIIGTVPLPAQESSLSAFVCPACKKPTARITCSEEVGTPRLLCETCEKESSCDDMLRAGATVDTILNNVEVETSNFDRGLQLDKVV